jgi:hypothetical protein
MMNRRKFLGALGGAAAAGSSALPTLAAEEKGLRRIGKLEMDGGKFVLRNGTKVAEFCLANGFFDIIQGPLGSGKTQAMVARIMRHIQQQRVSRITGRRMSRWGIVRNTYPELRNTTIKTWLEPTLVPEEIYGRMNWSPPPTHRLRFGDVDAEVIFLALDKPEDYNKLRSFEFTGIAWNELSFIPKPLIDEASGRLRYPGPAHGGSEWHGMLADSNAPDEDHWLAIMTGQVPMPPDLTDDERQEYEWPEGWTCYMQPPAVLEVRDARGQVTGYKVNPGAENLENLRKEYYTQSLRSKPKPWIDSRLRNVVALVVDGSPVWPQFSVDTHVSTGPLRPVPTWPVVVGLDFGRQPAAIFMQQIGERVFVQYELLGFNEGAVTFAPKVKRFLETHYAGMNVQFYGDPKGQDKGQSDERTAYDVFQAAGMTVTPAGPLDPRKMIATRVDAVTHLLMRMYDGRPCFVLSPLVRTLKLSMAGRYHLVREEDGELRPKKDKYSHPADALQYGVLGLGEGARMIGVANVASMKPASVYKRKSMRRISA